MPSDRDKQPPRPNPQIGADHGVDRAPLSERSHRASESAGQSSLSYASAGPTAVPAPVQVTVDMPPVILDPITAPTDEPVSAPPPPVFESISGVQAMGRIASPPSSPPVSSPRIVAEPSNKASGSFKAAPVAARPPSGPPSRPPSGPPSSPVGALTPRPPPLAMGDLPPMRGPSNTIVVRRRRATPVEKAIAFAVALLLICLVGVAAFWWARN